MRFNCLKWQIRPWLKRKEKLLVWCNSSWLLHFSICLGVSLLFSLSSPKINFFSFFFFESVFCSTVTYWLSVCFAEFGGGLTKQEKKMMSLPNLPKSVGTFLLTNISPDNFYFQCLMEGKIKWLPCSKGTKNTWHLIQIQNQ